MSPSGRMSLSASTCADSPSPRRSKVPAGSASGPVRCARPESVPRSPRLPATRSTSASGKACRSTARSRLPGPSGTFPLASAARPLPATRASSCMTPFAVVPRASSVTGGSPAPRVIAEPTPAADTWKRASGAERGPVIRALPLTVPANARSGRMTLAMSSGRSRIVRSTSRLSPTLPCAVRLPRPTSSPSGESSSVPPASVTVVGAVRRADTPCCRRSSRSSVAENPSSSRTSSPERLARVPMASRLSTSRCIRVPSTCVALALSVAMSIPASAMSLPVRVPSISGSPSASTTLASTSSAPIRVAPTATPLALARTVTP